MIKFSQNSDRWNFLGMCRIHLRVIVCERKIFRATRGQKGKLLQFPDAVYFVSHNSLKSTIDVRNIYYTSYVTLLIKKAEQKNYSYIER